MKTTKRILKWTAVVTFCLIGGWPLLFVAGEMMDDVCEWASK